MFGYILIGIGTILVAPFWAGLATTSLAFTFGIIGTSLILIGCWFQYNSSRPFERLINQTDWNITDHRASIVISPKQHGEGKSAQGEIYAKNEDGGYHACMAGVRHENGIVEFSSSGVGFDCKVVIR